MVVSLIFISFLLCCARGLRRVLFSWFCFLSLSTGPSGRGGVREHPRERTRTVGTAPAKRLAPQMVLASVGRDSVVRPRWIPRNRPRAARAGVLTRSAGVYQSDARSLPPTVVTRPASSRSRGGSAPQ